MSTQPKALHLADALELDPMPMGWYIDAAAELRRLHAEVERLTDCLRRANGLAEHFERHWYLRGDQMEELLGTLQACATWMEDLRVSGDAGNWDWSEGDEYMRAVAAIAKATGATTRSSDPRDTAVIKVQGEQS